MVSMDGWMKAKKQKREEKRKEETCRLKNFLGASEVCMNKAKG